MEEIEFNIKKYHFKIFKYTLIKNFFTKKFLILLPISIIIFLAIYAISGYVMINTFINDPKIKASTQEMANEFANFIFYIFISFFTLLLPLNISQWVFKKEINDKSILILTALPISKKRLIIEKILAVELFILILTIAYLLIAPCGILLNGQQAMLLTNLIYQKLAFVILWILLIELILTLLLMTIGLFLKFWILFIISLVIAGNFGVDFWGYHFNSLQINYKIIITTVLFVLYCIFSFIAYIVLMKKDFI